MARKFLITLLIIVSAALTATSFAAADGGAPDSNIPTYCITQVEPVSEDADPGEPAAETCFKTPTEASRFMESSSVVGIGFDLEFYGGYWWAFVTAHLPGCTDGSSFQVLGPFNSWNNKIESAKTYTGCVHGRHYDGWYLDGPVYDCQNSCGIMWAMANHTSSIKWSP